MKIEVEGMEVEIIKGGTKFFNHLDDITLIIEEKLKVESKIINTVNSICNFEDGK